MRQIALALAAVTALSIAAPAAATVVISSTGTIESSDPQQLNRVARNGIVSTWAAAKSYPGTLGVATHNYDLVNGTIAANALQNVYYEITYSLLTGDPLFSVAYLNSFDPNNIATNYLGDSGGSPSLGTSASYQVIVPTGGQLLINFSDVTGTPSGYSYTIAAFSDPNRGENFLTPGIPEPSSWAMMLLGFGAIGLAMRRRKKIAAIA